MSARDPNPPVAQSIPTPRPAEGSTLFESFDSWAQLLKAAPPAEPEVSDTPPTAADTSAEAPIFHPLQRRAMGLLHIVDDGRETGETIRIRDDSVVIGRSEGKVVIPHDTAMSARHARIDRLPDGSWQLSDEGSAAGTLVRAAAARLRHGSIVQLGATRLLFEVQATGSACLVEVRSNHLGRRHECAGATTIGRAGGVIGARMTGGGFGGSTVTLCESRKASEIAATLASEYQKATGITPQIFASRPSQGAHLVK